MRGGEPDEWDGPTGARLNHLDAYLKLLDEDRAYFTAADIQSFERYRTQLDDALRALGSYHRHPVLERQGDVVRIGDEIGRASCRERVSSPV